ncbi:MAG: hypothetical protein NVSMB9_01350 [Isosphaeraceae bacterium]
MPATKRYMNWTGVVFTPMNGAPMPITGVTSIQIDSGGSLLKFSGDGDRYNTTIVNSFNEPTITIHSADLASVRALPVGMSGTFTATHNDAKNGTGAGSMTYMLSSAVIASNPIHGTHRQFGQGVLTITAYAPDGVTNPLSVTSTP